MSENVFNIVQIGAQSGTAYSPGSAVSATLLYPIENPVNFDLDRASQFPKQDRGRNVRNSAGAGFHGVRGASCTLPSQVRLGDIRHMLEMHHCGGVVPTGPVGGLYTWVYPFEAVTPTIVPYTLEGGNTDASQQQARLTSSLINSLTLGFPDITAPGAAPWTVSADVFAFDREVNALTVSGAGEDEIQTVTISNADGGTFTLSFNGVATAPQAYNVTGANLQTALRAISSINGANVSVAGDGPYAITFIGSLAKTNVPMLVASATGLTNSGAPPDPSIAVVETNAGVPATAVAVSTDLEVVQGHLTKLYEGTTGTAFGSLAELSGSLKSYTQTTNRNLVRRAYGGGSDTATKYGFSDMSNGTFEAKVAISATAKTDFHDIWNVASPAPLGERRWRLQATGTSSKTFTIDLRAGMLAVPYDESDGERLFRVTGEFVDDSTLGASQTITIVNQLAS